MGTKMTTAFKNAAWNQDGKIYEFIATGSQNILSAINKLNCKTFSDSEYKT